MRKYRTAITGIGVIAPNGTGIRQYWEALKAGESGIVRITAFNPEPFPSQIAGEVRGFQPDDFMDKKSWRRMSRTSQFAVACARMALDNAQLAPQDISEDHGEIILGVSTSAMELIERQHTVLASKGPSKILPFGILAATPHSTTGEVIATLGLNVPATTLATGCASGLDAIGTGWKKISTGEAEIVLCGGADAPITPLILAGLCAANIVSRHNNPPEEASRPFDITRDGGVLAEGGGILVLEAMDRARMRGAPIYAELIGYGQYGDGKGKKTGSGLRHAMRQALYTAGLSTDAIGHISAHAPSDPLLDSVETEAIKEIFGARAYRIPLTSIKSMIGNPFGSIGVFQTAAAAMSLQEGVIPPTINYHHPDPKCDLDYTPLFARRFNAEYALINSHGFGGSNSSLLIKKAP